MESSNSHAVARFRPDIEGLRGIAILSVIAFHFDHRIISGGFVGVDVFFVISGFLITALLVRDLRSPTFSVASFYKRRIKRIFPALFFMLTCAIPIAATVLTPADMKDFGRTIAATALFVSNIEFARLVSYFTEAADLKPLLHTWTLAVEEQFYILFPLILIAVRRWLGGRFALVFVFGALLSLALSAWAVLHHPIAAFYLAPTRAYELLAGALLAVGFRLPVRANFARELLAASGLGMIVAATVLFDEATPFPGLNALLPTLGAAFIINAGCDGTSLTARLLSLQPIRWTGMISYSLYLWHWPLLVFARHGDPNGISRLELAAVIGASFVMAAISWRYVELPFRERAWTNRRMLAFGGACTVLFTAIGFAVFYADGFPGRYSPEARGLFAYSNEYIPNRARCHADGKKTRFRMPTTVCGVMQAQFHQWQCGATALAPNYQKR